MVEAVTPAKAGVQVGRTQNTGYRPSPVWRPLQSSLGRFNSVGWIWPRRM